MESTLAALRKTVHHGLHEMVEVMEAACGHGERYTPCWWLEPASASPGKRSTGGTWAGPALGRSRDWTKPICWRSHSQEPFGSTLAAAKSTLHIAEQMAVGSPAAVTAQSRNFEVSAVPG